MIHPQATPDGLDQVLAFLLALLHLSDVGNAVFNRFTSETAALYNTYLPVSVINLMVQNSNEWPLHPVADEELANTR